MYEKDGLFGPEAREQVLDGLLDGRIVVDDLARFGVAERPHDFGKGGEEVPDLDALEEEFKPKGKDYGDYEEIVK